MSTPDTNPIGGTNSVPDQSQTQGANQGKTPTAEQVAFAGGTVNSLEEIKIKSPEFYKAMMEGIAMHITDEMKDAETRRKKRKEEYERD